MEVVSILKRAARCITAIHEPQGIGGGRLRDPPVFCGSFWIPCPPSRRRPTLGAFWPCACLFRPKIRTAKPRAETAHSIWQPKRLIAPIPSTPPPHDRAYFEAHLRALANYYRNVSNGQLIIEYDVYPQDPNGSYVLDTPLIEYGNGRTRREIDERVTRLFRDGIRAADDADAIDFSQYRAFAVFHAGLGGEASQKLNDIPSAFIYERDLSELADGAIAVNNGAFYVTSGMLLPEAISADGRGGLNGTLVRFFRVTTRLARAFGF